jgi:hypothetical protein
MHRKLENGVLKVNKFNENQGIKKKIKKKNK